MPFAHLRRFGWSAGLPALAAVVGLAGALGLPSLERRLKASARAVATATEEGGAEPWLRITTRGRDVVVKGEAPNPELRADALARLQRLPGLRHVVGPLGLVEEASPFVWTATRAAPDRIDLSGNRPAEIGPMALATRLAPDMPPQTTLKDEATSARGAPPEFPAASAYAVEQLGALNPGGVVTLTDTILSFKGEAATIAAYDALRLALAHPPEGFSLGTIEILPPRIEDFRVAVARSADGVVLTGNVVSETARSAILARAAEIAGGLPVDDRMQTARGLGAAIDPAALMDAVFGLADLVQDGTVTFAGSRLSVSGAAIDAQAVGEIEAFVKNKRPTGVEAGALALETKPLAPYRVLVRREREIVTLSGHVPDEATRARVLASLRPRFFQERIVDKLRIAQGAPADLAAAVDAGVGGLSLLASGRVAITDRALTLVGDSLYRESAARLAADLPRKVPAGWRAEAAIKAPEGPVLTDPDSCRTLFAQAAQGSALRFAPGSVALRPEFYPVLDALATLAKTCPTLKISVAGHGDPPGAKPVAAAPAETTVAEAATDKAPADPSTKPAVDAAASAAPATVPALKPTTPKPTSPKPAPSQSAPSQSAPSKPAKETSKKSSSPNPAPAKAVVAEAVPEAELPRQRATAVVDYLLKAGIPDDAVTAAGATRPAQQGIGFSLDS
ncbi:BON domain-containing protein [Methylobacterium sp. Leaf466]|uniref:BON domain-containing protein n=1 Tax=Methylobacterium sp. Leaf466 TaxID=1736386 RepID=UPI0006F82020|nr:BON domain-containing protein [Methylobacterium sp. Leaf466]KQT84467.1 hypothetical protein ASG59_03610 [Methylobacterium sp. Leaf466]